MRKLTLLLVTPLLLMACATEGKFSTANKFETLEDCEDGGTYVRVYYEDSSLKIKPKINVKRGTGLEFRLKPKNSVGAPVDYEKMLVTIEGKSGGSSDDWIDVSGSFESSGGSLILCVPAGTTPGIYQYSVSVEQLGQLDPRANVER